MARTLVFSRAPGAPEETLRLLQHDIPSPGPSEVLVKMIAAPINPLDLLVLRDKYPVKPQSFVQGEMVPGYDGVAEIIKSGDNVGSLKAGNRVIIKRHGLGSWRTHAIFNANDVLKVPNEMEPSAAAILRMSMLMAYLLTEESTRHVQPGNWIILNAATSTIAHFMVQFANAKGLNVICVIRERNDAARTKQMLQRNGAALVLEEEEILQADALKSKKIVLGFDAVFGEAGQRLISTLSAGATYVTYGFLGGLGAGASIAIDQELIFLKNITFRGFRLSSALSTLSDGEQEALFVLFSKQLQQGKMAMPMLELINWPENGDVEVLRGAVTKANDGALGKHKMVFMFP